MDEGKPPSSKINMEGAMDISPTDIPLDDIKGKQGMGFWDRLTKPILYPAGSSICTRCHIVLMDIQEVK